MKYVYIAQHKKTWPVDLMCRLLGATRGGYYGYQRRNGGRPDFYHLELLEAVRDIETCQPHMDSHFISIGKINGLR